MNRGIMAESREHFPFSYFLLNVVARDGRRREAAGTQQAGRRTHDENVAPNNVHSLGFLVLGDSTIDILTLDFICLELQTIGCSIKDDKAVQIVSKPRM